MTLAIHNTTDWPYERILDFGPDITAAFAKLAKRFPKDMTVRSLFDEVQTGRQQLWLILEGEEFRSFVTTEIKVNDYTGHKSVQLMNLAGEGGLDLVPLIQEIEKWAAGEGAQEIVPLCRVGFRKPLEELGYKMSVCLFRKSITANDEAMIEAAE